MVSICHVLNCAGDKHRRSQLLPTEKTSSMGLKSGEYGGKDKGNTPASRSTSGDTSS